MNDSNDDIKFSTENTIHILIQTKAVNRH